MDPRPLSAFLSAYEKLPVPKRELLKVVNDFLGEKGTISDASFKDGIVYIKGSASVKQSIFIKKKQFLEHVKKSSLKLPVTDVR